MKFAYLVLAGLAAVLLAVPASANPCNTPVCNTPVLQTQVVVPQVVLPLYGAAYTGESDAETRDLLKALLAEIKALRADIQTRPAGGGNDTGDGPVVPPLKAIDVGALVKNRCAACHTSKVAEDKGGGLELVTDDGKLVKLSPPTRREAVKRIGNGTMPPPGKGGSPLTPTEREAFKAALSDVPAIPKGKN